MADPAELLGPEAPPWLQRALDERPTEHEVEVDGVAIRYRAWGEDPGTPVVLVHGGLAHGRWWDHIAPLLTGRRVVAPDLSGHGDSGNRPDYDAHRWGREILAVAADAGLDRPVVVGHSMGGQPAVASAVASPDAVSGVITLDTRFNDQAYQRHDRVSRHYATLEDGVRAFRPVHAAPDIVIDPALTHYIASTSLGRDAEGWRWKRDDGYHIKFEPFRDLLPGLRVPYAVVRTEFGLVSEADAAEMRSLVLGPSLTTEIPDAGHNPMLEQPLALVAVLRALLATAWPSTSATVPAPSPAT